MPKRLSPKQFFLLLYLLCAGSMAAAFILPNVLSPLTTPRVFYGVPYFIVAFIAIVITFSVIIAMPRVRIALHRVEIPRKYTFKHFLLLILLSAQAFILDVILHNVVCALGILCFGPGFWEDEALFFILATLVVPAGLIAGAFGRLWDWSVTWPIEQMKVKGIDLPTAPHYFVPFGSYGWLRRYGKGVEGMTGGRIRAAGVFAAVFFLGFLGFVIVRDAIRRRGFLSEGL
jgi:hypothetical protein